MDNSMKHEMEAGIMLGPMGIITTSAIRTDGIGHLRQTSR